MTEIVFEMTNSISFLLYNVNTFGTIQMVYNTRMRMHGRISTNTATVFLKIRIPTYRLT